MVQVGALWGLRRAFLTNENPFCQNNVDSAAYSRIGSYAPDYSDNSNHTCKLIHVLIYFSSIVEQVMFAYVNHARIRSWNQPVLSNEGKVLAQENTIDMEV